MSRKKRQAKSTRTRPSPFSLLGLRATEKSTGSSRLPSKLCTFNSLWFLTPLLFAIALTVVFLLVLRSSSLVQSVPLKERVVLAVVLLVVPSLTTLFDYISRLAITLLNRKHRVANYWLFRYLYLPELVILAVTIAVFFGLLHSEVRLTSSLDLFIEKITGQGGLRHIFACVYSIALFGILKACFLMLVLFLVCLIYLELGEVKKQRIVQARQKRLQRKRAASVRKHEASVQNLLLQIAALSASVTGRSDYYEQQRQKLVQAKAHIDDLLAESRKAVSLEASQLSSPWLEVIEDASQCTLPESQQIAKQLSALESHVRAKLFAPWREIGNVLEEILQQIDQQIVILNTVQEHEESQLSKVAALLSDAQQPSSRSQSIGMLQAALFQGTELFEAATTSVLTQCYSSDLPGSEAPSVDDVLTKYRDVVTRHQQIVSNTSNRMWAYRQRLDSEMASFLATPNPMQAGFVGTRSLLWHELPAHVFAIGTTGRGKSMFLEMTFGPWFYAVARRIHNGWKSPLRMFIFDVDGEILPICEGVGIPSSHRFFLNPYEARGEADGFIGWAAGRDLISFRHISRFVEVLFSEQHEGRQNQGTSDHFVKQARPIMECIMVHLQLFHGTEWDLHDAFTILFDYDRLMEVLRQAPAPFDHVYRMVFDREEHGQDSIATLWGQVGDLREIAALWHARTRRGSLREWFNMSGVFTISQQGGDSEGLKRLNQAFTQLLSDIVVKELPEAEINTACIFDEMVRLWPVPGLAELFTNGRKKGVICCGAFQNVQEAEDKVGKGAINSILDQSDIIAMLGTNSRYTAEFNSKRCGDEEIDEYLMDVSFGSSDQSSVTRTISESTGTTESVGETEQKGWSNVDSWGSQWTKGPDGSSNSGSTGGQSSTSGGTSVTVTQGTQLTQGTSEAYGMQQGSNQSVTIRQQRRQKPRLEATFWLDIPKTNRNTGMTGVIEVPDPVTQKKRRRVVTLSPELLDAVRPERTESPGFIAVAPQVADRLLSEGTQGHESSAEW